MMKIYFERTNGNNLVIAAEGRSAKIYDAAPSGIYAGVDLYAEDAADQLREKFLELDEAGELNGFNEMGGEEVEIGAVLLGELVDAELVFSDGEGIEVWSVEVAPDFNDDFFSGTEEECREYCGLRDYKIGEDCRLARISLDDDFCVREVLEVINE